MNLSNEDRRILLELLVHPGSDVVELARVARLDPTTDFQNADWRGLNFGAHDLTGYRFKGADIRGADFSKTWWTERAVFHGAIKDSTIRWPKNGYRQGNSAATSRRHQTILRRFKDKVEAHTGEALQITDICREIGVSLGTLRTVCREYLGVSPQRYIALRRLHRARRALVLGDPATTTVTDIATSMGFRGSAGSQWPTKELFGEAPSATLRGPPDDWPA